MESILHTLRTILSGLRAMIGMSESGMPRANRHWLLLLLIFVVLSTAMLLFSLYLFLQINEGDIFLVDPQEQVSLDTIDRAKLERVIDMFKERSVLFEARKTTVPSTPDPR